MSVFLFNLAPGSKIEKLPNGLLAFEEPGKMPFTVQVTMGPDGVEVIKTYVAPDCETVITIEAEK